MSAEGAWRANFQCLVALQWAFQHRRRARSGGASDRRVQQCAGMVGRRKTVLRQEALNRKRKVLMPEAATIDLGHGILGEGRVPAAVIVMKDCSTLLPRWSRTPASTPTSEQLRCHCPTALSPPQTFPPLRLAARHLSSADGDEQEKSTHLEARRIRREGPVWRVLRAGQFHAGPARRRRRNSADVPVGPVGRQFTSAAHNPSRPSIPPLRISSYYYYDLLFIIYSSSLWLVGLGHRPEYL